ncbi:MAG TPA: cupredoxin domain-containing protein [Acidimicrobiales bacterium]|nr:cupredoxin domain-containing protein [Acidimicrobiales bacterium]
MRARPWFLVAVAVAGLALAGCGSSDNGGTISGGDDSTTAGGAAKTVTVNAVNFAYNPTEIQLTAGQDVQFQLVNGDGTTHNLTVEGLGVDQDAAAGKTAQAPVTKAPKAGTYPFHCEYHPNTMKGTITVK